MSQSIAEKTWFLVLLYLTVAAIGILVVYLIAPSNNQDWYRDFWTRVSVVLVADGVLINIIAAKTTLNKQIQAAKDLEEQKEKIILAVENKKIELSKDLEATKGEIVRGVEDHKKTILLAVEERKKELSEELELKKGEIVHGVEDHKKLILLAVEDRKKELSEKIEDLKGQIGRQNDFLKQTISVKAVAYDKIFIASNLCYRQLQELTLGKYDRETTGKCEYALREAEALAANLDDKDQNIVQNLVQIVFNIIDSVDEFNDATPKASPEKVKTAYQDIWNKYAKSFGLAMDDIRERSIFRNKSTDI